ncbi:16S rRNA (cytidine(1402)-2'-O)-methyltransferase [Chloroflexus sp.]|uniref:16S rRNA (cytidine(1402)-2'-O)-methyltransferase n=1 Tax=Chloroflexus sp. TaxID=1904827 RepID=UPI00298EFCF0|nr:16S rRNA (cytidine(1402)-2'-O)-methyltransferase [Chloroflexus sp.]MCS6887580.1 16S rRNA (cytidine(1402)-2'-O)-methyltransferase [Chloroflexus sp.]MCX7859786.1 16S rRNA (cytidine(1402)-2'-O)-methyltransferase [Chloroflexus sp.]MDW8403123.1 16S rRNA (cytidine(1402)-2'-O)-methyltransferase [Chloroflexus sp.]
MGTLYLVATPIGNLEDITLRALRVLREAQLIAAEDTRHTRILLDHYQITTPCISYHEHNKLARRDEILAALQAGDVALVSDAGTPAIADPGHELVQACLAAGHTVTPIPGPSAPLAALIASGIDTGRFAFIGFLPRQPRERRELLSEIADWTITIICFETPHRLLEALRDIAATLGERQLAVANDLTKRFEAIFRGTANELIEHFTNYPPRGEFTIVIAGATPTGERKRDRQRLRVQPASAGPETIAAYLRQLAAQGVSGSAAVRRAAQELGAPKNTVYDVWREIFGE